LAPTSAAQRPHPADQTASVLENLVSLLRVRPQIQQLCEFGGSWISEHDVEVDRWAPFHIVTHGECIIEVEGLAPRRLQAGDVAVLPHGDRHRVRAARHEGEPTGLIETHNRQSDGVLLKSSGDGTPETELVCGRMKFLHAHENAMISALPKLVIIGSEAGSDPLRISRHVEFIREELADDRLGAAAIAEEIATALMIVVLRAHFESSRTNTGILALLSQPQTARVLSAMLKNPSKDWSLDNLAEEAGTSRATLVRIFRKIVDKPPLAFLTDLRLDLAHQKLKATKASLAQIADEVGYQSENSLSRAYTRRFGHPPGADR
jgi:AraC family transcriptional activator of mtrCDE